jgi:hypothetical protein
MNEERLNCEEFSTALKFNLPVICCLLLGFHESRTEKGIAADQGNAVE